MTIPNSDKSNEKQQQPQPSAPPSYFDEYFSNTKAPGAEHVSSSYGATTNQQLYDTESLLPIATPLIHDEALQSSSQGAVVPMAEVLGFDDKDVRRRFIQKVYGILAIQMMLTAAVCAWMILYTPTQQYVLTHAWPVYTSMVLSLIFILALMCFKNQSPHNFILLGAFTFVEAFLVGTVTTTYCAMGYKGVVLEAVFITCVVFMGLTLFTCQSKINFSFLGAGLSMGLGVLLLWGVCSLIFGFDAGYYYALFGCIIFCGCE